VRIHDRNQIFNTVHLCVQSFGCANLQGDQPSWRAPLDDVDEL